MKFLALSKLGAALAAAALPLAAGATIDNTDEAAELMGMASSMSGSYTVTSVGNGKSITEVRLFVRVRVRCACAPAAEERGFACWPLGALAGLGLGLGLGTGVTKGGPARCRHPG